MAEIPISFAVVDEAHCITEWSHNFRPSYFRLGRVLRSRLKVGAVLAATATATARTEGSILAALEIPRTAVIRSENVRKNITLSVSRCSEEERKGKLLELLKNEPFSSMKSSIVYCTFQTDADHLARFLTANGIRAKSYHAGKNSEERRKIQQSFCSNRLPVVVATVAFGMGLDKSDVGAVIHCSVPRSLEHYVQEVGRAGRDGAAAFCHLFLIDRDYLKLRSLAHSAGVDENAVHNFLLRLFKPPTAQEGEEGREGELGYRSLAIESTSKELDIKEEVMHTILAYLEAEDSTYVRVMSPINVTCDITFHQKSPQQIAERNPLIGQILKRSTAKAGHYVFNVPMVARHMAESPMAVMNELYRLKAQGAIGWSLRDPALLVEVLRQPPCLRQLAAAMAARLADVERCKVEKLDCMYKAAARAATAGSSAACQVALQERISAYFQEEDCGRSTAGEAPDIVLKSSPFLRADIKVFLRSNEHMAFTGRAIARIFHGIWSPAFPYGQWADNSFWGRYMNVDFYETRRTVTMELLSLREENRRPADER